MPGNEPLSEEEVEKLRKLLPYADMIEAEMEYKTAQRIVFRTWRGLIIGLAGVIAAGLILKENLKAILIGMTK